MPQDRPSKSNVRCQLIFILYITSLVFVLLMDETKTTVIQTVTKKSKILILSTDKPEFVVRTNYSDSNIPLGASVSNFTRNHIVVTESE